MTLGWPCCCGCYWYNWNWTNVESSPAAFLTSVGSPSGWGSGSTSLGPVITYSGGGSAISIPAASNTQAYTFEIVFANYPDGSDCKIYMGLAEGETSGPNYVEFRSGSSGYWQVVTGDTKHEIIAANTCGAGANISAGIFKQPDVDEWVLSLFVGLQSDSTPTFQNIGGFLQVGVEDWEASTAGQPEIYPLRTSDCCGTILTMNLPYDTVSGTGVAVYLAGSEPIGILQMAGAEVGKNGIYDYQDSSYDPTVECTPVIAQDCGCDDCILYISVSGIEPADGTTCTSNVNGTHALTSLTGALTAQNGMLCNGCGSGEYFFNTCAWGCLLGTSDGQCCGGICVTMYYSPGSGTQFTGYLALGTSAYETDSPCEPAPDGTPLSSLLGLFGVVPPVDGVPQDCAFAPAGNNAVFQTTVADGADGVPGGRLDCGSLSEIGMTLVTSLPTFTGWTIDGGATMGIYGSNNTCPDVTDCVSGGGVVINACTNYAVFFGICDNNDAGDSFTFKLNGTSIGTVTEPGGTTMGVGEFWSTIGQTASAFGTLNATVFPGGVVQQFLGEGVYTGEPACGGPAAFTNSTISSSLFVTGSNTLECIYTPAGGSPGDESGTFLYVIQTDADGNVCNVLLNEDWGPSEPGQGDVTFTFNI